MKSVVGDVKKFISAAATSQEAGFVFAINQLEQEFEEPTGQNAISQECTLCLIKPHALVDGLTGKIIHDIVISLMINVFTMMGQVEFVISTEI